MVGQGAVASFQLNHARHGNLYPLPPPQRRRWPGHRATAARPADEGQMKGSEETAHYSGNSSRDGSESFKSGKRALI